MNLTDKTTRLAASLDTGTPLRNALVRVLLATSRVAANGRRDIFLPDALRGTPPNVDSEGTDVAIWTWDNARGKPTGVAFVGTSMKPSWYYEFPNEARRDEYIRGTIEGRKKHRDDRQQKRQERQDFRHDLAVGDILYSRWGYNQTNINYYQVVGVTAKQVAIRELETTGNTVRETRYVMPVENRFAGPVMKKLVNPKGFVTITNYEYAYKWDGKAKAETAAGYGH